MSFCLILWGCARSNERSQLIGSLEILSPVYAGPAGGSAIWVRTQSVETMAQWAG
jgi:hypothetical protein